MNGIKSRNTRNISPKKIEKNFFWVGSNPMAANFKDTILRELEALQLADEYRKKPFQVKAYVAAIEAIQLLPAVRSVEDVEGLKGVGEKIRQKVQEILETGHLRAADEVRASLPLEAYKTLRDIHGIGPAKAAQLIERGITTIGQLREASEATPRNKGR
jgi:DNA polymerase lambda